MSFQLSAEASLATFVGAMLPRFSPKGRALYIHVKCSLDCYPDEKDDDGEHWSLHLIFERPSNYTKVWVSLEDQWHIPRPDTFVMRSDHDSCWRTDGFRDLFQEYLSHRDALEERQPGERQCAFHIVNKVHFVEVEYEPRDLAEPHEKKLTKIEKAA